MTKENAYTKLAEAQLEEWRAQIDQLKAQAKQADAKTQVEVHKAIQQVEERYDRARAGLNATAESLKGAMADLQSGVERAWDEMKQSSGRAASRFDDTGPRA